MTFITSLCVCMFICLPLCLQSLSRLTQVVPAVFLAVIDTCGPAAILEGVGGVGARVQQHLLTAMATALLSSRTQTHRFTQNKVRVHLCLQIVKHKYREKPRHKQPYFFNVIFYQYYYYEIFALCFLSLCQFSLFLLPSSCLTVHKLICQELLI